MNEGSMSPGKQLRSLLERGEPVVAPGCADAISARLIEKTGYEVAYMSGGWTSLNRGFLDLGLLSINEMVDNARYITGAIDIPLISDIDTGFGSFVNVQRCIGAMEQAGVAGIHIEDQRLPKKCGLVAGKEVVSVGEMASKLRAAADVRNDLFIICRTDALLPEGLERTIERGHAYFEAGADMLWVEGFRTEDEAAAVAEAFPGQHLLFNRTPKGYGPLSSLEQIRDWGYSLVFLCVHLALAAMVAQQELLEEFKATGACDSYESRMYDLHEAFELLGESEAIELERRYTEVQERVGAGR